MDFATIKLIGMLILAAILLEVKITRTMIHIIIAIIILGLLGVL